VAANKGRVNVVLRPDVREALMWLQGKHTGYSQVELVNRAILMLRQVEEFTARGAHLMLVEGDDQTRVILL